MGINSPFEVWGFPCNVDVAAGWLWAAFWVLWLVWGWISTRRRPVGKGRMTKGLWLVGRSSWILAAAAIIFMQRFGRRLPHQFLASALWPGHPGAAAVGFLLELLGIGLAVWARYHLGTFWSSVAVLRQGHRVVDSGPYRLVRHPIYSGLLLGMLGTFLMAGSTFWLLALVLGILGIAGKIYAEERLLKSELGEEYVRYMARTHRLIPWLL